MNTPSTTAPQLTLKAIILSVILTVILASANTYVGLFAGLTVATAIPGRETEKTCSTPGICESTCSAGIAMSDSTS